MSGSLSRRRVGKTDLEVTVLGLGGAPLGNLFEAIPEERALATVEAAFAAGVGLFDTAPQYGHGLSEHRFGHVLRDKPRDGFALSTKVGRLLRPSPPERIGPGPFKRTLNFAIHHNYSYDAAMRSLEDSWQRLGMERIDIALIHDVDRRHQGEDYDRRFAEAVDGAVRALSELRDAGTIRAIGIGVNEVEPCVRFAHHVALDCYMLAGRFTLLEQEGLDELFALAEAQGFSFLIAGPFNSGILATGAGSDAVHDYRAAGAAVVERVRRLESVCARHRVPLGAAALHFLLAHPRVASVVTGAVRPEEILQNVEWMSQAVPDALWDDLRAEGLIGRPAPRSGGRP